MYAFTHSHSNTINFTKFGIGSLTGGLYTIVFIKGGKILIITDAWRIKSTLQRSQNTIVFPKS